MRVTGRSMRPLLTEGSQVRVRAVAGPPRMGALVAVDLGGHVAIHVVARSSHAHVVTRGIACAHEDPARPPAAVLGEVDSIRRAADGAWLPIGWRAGIGLLALAALRTRVGRVVRALR